MPVTILSSDLAYARVDGDRLGPFEYEYEDQAIEAACVRYGALVVER